MAQHAFVAKAAVPGIATATDRPSPRGATRWWQWMLVYPTLGVTVMSAVPTWVTTVQSFTVGVARRDVAFAEEQNELFQKNMDCLLRSEIQPIKNNRNVEVGAQVCPSGDVLIRVTFPGGEGRVRWLSVRSLEAFSGFGPSSAFAASRVVPVSDATQTVIHQRWLRPGLLKQRVREGVGCVDVVINTYTGTVVSRTAVACSAGF